MSETNAVETNNAASETNAPIAKPIRKRGPKPTNETTETNTDEMLSHALQLKATKVADAVKGAVRKLNINGDFSMTTTNGRINVPCSYRFTVRKDRKSATCRVRFADAVRPDAVDAVAIRKAAFAIWPVALKTLTGRDVADRDCTLDPDIR